MNLIAKFLILIVFFMASLTNSDVFAQPDFDPVKFEESIKNASFKEKLEAANALMEDQLFVYAVKVLVRLAEEKPDNANVNYKTGLCYLNISNERTKALPYLLKASEKVVKNYDPFTVFETNAPVDTYYQLGLAYHLTDDCDKATDNFNKFLEQVTKKHILFDKANLHIKQCVVAKDEFANPKEHRIANVGPEINGPDDDFSPVVTLDEGAMFFTSRRMRPDSSNATKFSPQDGKHYEDVYVSYRDFKSKKWLQPEVLDQISSVSSNQATISVSGDGQTLFIYRDIKGNGEIYYAEYEGDTYGASKSMGGDVNTQYWETHGTLSADGQTFYFVSDRPGGIGGRDIWKVVKLPNGEWSKASNLGAPINSPYDEDSPFFHPDGKTLYFSSNGEKSMGGFDIFFSQLDMEGKWGEPINIGYPLNTVDDDIFFTTNASGDKGYYSSAKAGGFGEKDIYLVELKESAISGIAVLKGYIDPGPGKTLPEGIVIYVYDLTTGGDPEEYRPNVRNGSYIFNLKPCNEYMVEYTLNGNTFYETEYKIPCEANFYENDIVLSLDGIRLDGGETPILADTTSLPDGDKTKWRYQLLSNGVPVDNALIEMLEDGLVFSSDMVDADGYFIYKEMKGQKTPQFRVDIKDPSLCDELTLKLVDDKGNIVIESIRDIRCKTTTTDLSVIPVEFQKFYGYNLKGIAKEEKRWNEFVQGTIDIINKRGSVKIDIEGSASYVPTKTFGSNTVLADKRAKDAKQMLLDELKAKGVDAEKVKFVAVNAKVQGPKYKGDYQNKEKYGQYQYIFIKAY
jgi:hypothetical protein